MHKIIKSYLQQFIKEQESSNLEESVQFEQFVNYCLLSKYYLEQFEIEDITVSSPDDESIDGAAILIDDQLVLTSDDASKIFEKLSRRRNVRVEYLFFQAKRSEGFDAGDILKFGTSVSRLLENDDFSPDDDLLCEIKETHNLIVDTLDKVENGRPNLTLHYACTGNWSTGNNLQKQLDFCKENLKGTGLFYKVEFLPIDREKLIDAWNYTRSPVEATFEFRGSTLPFPPIEQVEDAFLAIVPAKGFIQNVLSDDEGRIRNSIFEQNVRAFLGDENLVNKKIKESLEDSLRHDKFSILNNGITIVSPEAKVQKGKIFVRDFQIVNGCQTSHVLFRNRAFVSDNIWLPIKIIQAENPDILAQVVEATNSQSDVAESQFVSIRPFVQKVEAYFDSFENEEDGDRRIYFERRTRQYSGQRIGKKRLFDIQRLARAYVAMFLDLPHLAARYPTQTFQEKSSELYQPSHREHAYYTAALTLYRLELALGNDYVPREYQRYKWHLLMITRFQLTGSKMPTLNSKKLDKYCDKIITSMSPGGKGSASPFISAIEILKNVGEATRDRLKRQTYTNLIKEELLRRK